MNKKLISIVTPCYNEEENVKLVYTKAKEIFFQLSQYEYEHIFIDNCSTDKSLILLREIAKVDKKVKVIVNSRNFGHIKSPYYALLQSNGDAVILLVADLQDPPEMIKEFIQKWEEGYKVVIGEKQNSKESAILYLIRKTYYHVVNKLAEIPLCKNFTGFGLYDREIIDILKTLNDPYPYFRGIICEIGFPMYKIGYEQPRRKRGITKNNMYTLYDIAMLGITSHSKVPLRIATISGFIISILCLITAGIYFMYKLIRWDSFSVGIAPIVIGLFFFFSINLFFLGVVGEYIGAIHTQVLKRPLVIEKERINFEDIKMKKVKNIDGRNLQKPL